MTLVIEQELIAFGWLLNQVLHVLHGACAETRSEFFLFFTAFPIWTPLVVETDLAKSTIYIDLPAVLCALNLHLPLEVLAEFESILLLRHDLVGEGATPERRLVVLHHIDLHEVLPHLLRLPEGFRLLRNGFCFLLHLSQDCLRGGTGLWSGEGRWLRFLRCDLLLNGGRLLFLM